MFNMARQTDMLDNKIEVGKIGGGVINIAHIESVGAQRIDGRSLVHMDVLDAQFLSQRQIFIGPRVVEAPAARAVAPLGRIELEPADRVLRHHPAKRVDTRLFVPRIERAAQ